MLPARVVLDNFRAGVIKPDIYDPKINRAYGELAEHYGVLVDPARVAKPKDKPRIEAVQLYIRRSFFAGRDFASLAHGRRRQALVAEVAGRRTPRVLEGRTPLQVFDAEEAGVLLPLPMVPFELARWSRPKVGPDAHAKVGRTLYSLPYRLIGRRLDARATAVVVQFFLDGELVKTHPFQARGRRTDWADLPEQRVGFFMRTPTWCRAQAGDGRPGVRDPGRRAAVGQRLVPAAPSPRRAAIRPEIRRRPPRSGLPASHRRRRPLLQDREGHPGRRHRKRPASSPLPGVDTPAWLRGPAAFGEEQR